MMDFTPQQLALIEKYRGINTDHLVVADYKEHYTDYLRQMVGFEVDDLYWSVYYSQGDGACFTGREYETTQMLMWVLLPDYRVWWKALIESGLGKDYYSSRPQYWANDAVHRYTEKMGFQGEIIRQQYDRYYDQLLDKLGDNVSHFLNAGVELEVVGLTVTHKSSHYYHSNTVNFTWEVPEPMIYVSSKYGEDDIRRVVLESKAEDFHIDLECVIEQVEDYLRSVMDEIYSAIREDIEYLESDGAVWESIVANELDDELEEDAA